MKKIKNLEIKVTYLMSFTDIEVPDKVYDDLVEAHNYYRGELWLSETQDASTWLEFNGDKASFISDADYVIYELETDG